MPTHDMVTAEDIAAVPLSAGAPEDERLSEDIGGHPRPAGRVRRSEGDERALFAMLDGHLEVVKLFDGVERILGHRLPGDIFGEVPITLGTPFPAGYRAVEPSRVLRLEPEDYYAIASREPRVALKVGEIARGRIGGLQGHRRRASAAAGPSRRGAAGPILLRACGGSSIATRSRSSGPGGRTGAAEPGIRFADGRPDDAGPGGTTLGPRGRWRRGRVADPGVGTEYDTIVIGAGPAGLAAAVYGASEGLRTIVVEREAPGGQAGTSSRIENYLGFPSGVSGEELGAARCCRHSGSAPRCSSRGDHRRRPGDATVTLDGGDTLHARTIVIATGVTWRHLPIEDFERLVGKGIYYGAVRSEAPAHARPRRPHVGAGNSAGRRRSSSPTTRAASRSSAARTARKSMSHYLVDQIGTKPNIEVETRREVAAVHGDGSLEAIDMATARPERPRAVRPAACSSSSAPMPRPAGCAARSRSTSVATS